MSIEFWLTTLVVVLIPGTGVVYTLAVALARGTRAGAVAAAGCTLGIVPHVLAAVTGLAAVLHASAVAYEVLRYAGVAYLLFLAWRTLRDTGTLALTPARGAPSSWTVIRSGILLNLLNPKLTVFFVAFLPQFTDASAGPLPLLGLSVAFMVTTFVVFVAYAVVAARVRDRVLSRPRVMAWMRRVFAGSFVALSARLAVTPR